MTEPIRGKVAKVLNSREIAINTGSAKGVEVGMYFDVLKPENITDPVSGEDLGAIERPKVRVRITHVQEKLSVAATYRKTRVNIGGSPLFMGDLGGFSRMLMPPKWINKYETLKTEEKTWDDLDEEDSYVSVGDLVVQVVEEKKDEEQEDAKD